MVQVVALSEGTDSKANMVNNLTGVVASRQMVEVVALSGGNVDSKDNMAKNLPKRSTRVCVVVLTKPTVEDERCGEQAEDTRRKKFLPQRRYSMCGETFEEEQALDDNTPFCRRRSRWLLPL